jgi:hypothetical protein
MTTPAVIKAIVLPFIYSSLYFNTTTNQNVLFKQQCNEKQIIPHCRYPKTQQPFLPVLHKPHSPNNNTNQD